METRKHLGIIKAKAHSIRCPDKNWRDFCGRPMLHYTLDVLVKSRVLDKIIVSTVQDGADKLTSVVKDYSDDIEVFVRDGNDPAQIERHGFDYTASHYPEFTFCTALYGTAWYVRPSWIRASDKAMRTLRMFAGKFDYPVTHVAAFPGMHSDQVSSWRLGSHKWPQEFAMEHRGCNFDIDTMSEFRQSEKVMQALLDTDYFEPENIHLEDSIWETQLDWNRI